MVDKQGLAREFHIESAATSTEEIWNGVGNPVYPPAQAELLKHGISCGDKRAVQLTRSDYAKYNYLIGMDGSNIRNMRRMLGADPEGKIYKMLFFVGEDRDVADPWYTGNFRATYEDVEAGCRGFLEFLTKKGEI